MGWFTSIVHGVGSAVNWAISNAGDIAGIVDSARKVSGLSVAENDAEEAPAPETSKDFFEVFRAATEALEDRAEKKVKEMEAERDWDDPKHPREPRIGGLSGIWTSPTLFTNTSKEVPKMYRDLVKLLAELSVPTMMKRGKEYQDVAELVAQSIFAYNPEPPSQISNFDASNDDHLPSLGLPLRDDDKSWQLFVSHSYYTLPMGRSGTDVTWHGAIHVKMKSSRNSHQQHAQEMDEFRFLADIEPLATDVWLVTFQIGWKAVKVARAGYKFIKAVLDEKDKDKVGYKVTYNFLDGQLQTVKIRAPAKKSPAETLFYLQEAVAEAVVKMNKSPQDMYFGSGNGTVAMQYQTPHVVLKDSTLLTADTTVGDGMVVVAR